MSMIIAASIDLTKIDKSRIVEGKNGAKYFNISVLVNDEKDKYGNDVGVVVGQTKEEREAKEKKIYLGNGRVVWTGNNKQSAPAPKGKTSANASSNDVDDLPF